MPMYDYSCPDCKQICELFTKADDMSEQCCPVCASPMNRILSWGGMNVFREEAPWLNSVLDVVAKDSDKPHTKAFLAEPTRTNYKKWMKAEGIRPLENGEQHASRVMQQQREAEFERSAVENAMRRLQERRRIEM
jgi:putative FmdB family regulatory protein